MKINTFVQMWKYILILKTTDEILEINLLKNMDLTADEYLYCTRSAWLLLIVVKWLILVITELTMLGEGVRLR